MHCRICKKKKLIKVIDLGNLPLSNTLLSGNHPVYNETKYLLRDKNSSFKEKKNEIAEVWNWFKKYKNVVGLNKFPIDSRFLNYTQKKEKSYNLHLYICKKCWLLQTKDFVDKKELFNNDYPYLSSTSTQFLLHSKNFFELVNKKLNLNKNSFVIEIASNDGYLLQYFKKRKINSLGVEPVKSVAKLAMKKKINTIVDFFNTRLAKKIKKKYPLADLIICNNVIAHVPNLNDFFNGLKILLKANGIISIEIHHVLNLIKFKQFDNIYHEHYSYFSLSNIEKLCSLHGLKIISFKKINTQGGSLRIFVAHQNYKSTDGKKINKMIKVEKRSNLNKISTYRKLDSNKTKTRDIFLKFIEKINRQKKIIIAYGAAAKGSTFLNYCKISFKQIPIVIDKSISKQNKYLPGSKIPIVGISAIKKIKPDYVLILPWNLKNEIINQIKFVKSWGGKFLTIMPRIKID